jgi:hypothetical protein
MTEPANSRDVPVPVPRVPPGQPTLRRKPSDLDALSVITSEDVDAARRLWKRFAPDGYQGLIDAKADPPVSRRGPA